MERETINTHCSDGQPPKPIATRAIYFSDGRPHKATGPAYLRYDDAGQIIKKRYYLHGVKLAEDEWRNQSKPPEILAVIARLHMPIAEAIAEYYCFA
jgi:hypothetical protein